MANFDWLSQWKQVGRKNGHSAFDLTKRQAFHLPNGQITPIHFIETVPDDHFQISLDGILRSQTMNTAAYFSGKGVFSVFFVPYSQLWHNFDQFISQKDDRHSTAYKGSAYAPNMKLSDIMLLVITMYQEGVVDEFGFSAAWSAARMLQYCKICNLYPLLHALDAGTLDLTKQADYTKIINYISRFSNKYVNLWRPLAYQHIFYDYFRNKYYDDEPLINDPDNTVRYVDIFNVDDISCNTVANSHIPHGGLTTENEFTFTDTEDARNANFFVLRYAQYRHDLFTSLLPSTQFGAVSSLSFASNQATIDVTTDTDEGSYTLDNRATFQDVGSLFVDGNDSSLSGTEAGGDVGTLAHTHSLHGYASVSLPNFIDVLSFRRAELLQAWKQNALRAGNMTDANFKAHYGVHPYYYEDNNVRFLGQFECSLNINPVTATAATNDSVNGNVGDLAAYGVGNVVGSPIDFECKDFGVIVCIAHFQSEVYYSANGLDKQNTLLEPFDYFTPEFENVGLEVVSEWQQTLGLPAGNASNLDKAFGFTPPYTMYKTAVDEVFGEYGKEFIYDGNNGLDINWSGSLSAWTAKRSDLLVTYGEQGEEYNSSLLVTRFYQSPALTDSLFGVAFDGKPETDPFGFAVTWNIKPVRPMSVLGIPIFG